MGRGGAGRRAVHDLLAFPHLDHRPVRLRQDRERAVADRVHPHREIALRRVDCPLRVHQRSVTPRCRGAGLLGQVRLRFVPQDLDVALVVARRVPQRRHGALGEERLAVAPQMPAVVGGAAVPVGVGHLLFGHARGAVLGREDRVDGTTQHVVGRPAQDLFGPAVPNRDRAVAARGDDGHVCRAAQDGVGEDLARP